MPEYFIQWYANPDGEGEFFVKAESYDKAFDAGYEAVELAGYPVEDAEVWAEELDDE